MAELCLPSRTILSIVSQEHMPRDRDASNPVAFDPVPPTGSVAVPFIFQHSSQETIEFGCVPQL